MEHWLHQISHTLLFDWRMFHLYQLLFTRHDQVAETCRPQSGLVREWGVNMRTTVTKSRPRWTYVILPSLYCWPTDRNSPLRLLSLINPKVFLTKHILTIVSLIYSDYTELPNILLEISEYYSNVCLRGRLTNLVIQIN